MNNKRNKTERFNSSSGGTLRIYEVGIVNVLYNWIKKDCIENDNVFDIIGGYFNWCCKCCYNDKSYKRKKEKR